MTLIHVPRPKQSAMDPDRPVNALLKAQIQHLHDAELKLPVGWQTDIYINAIKTEGEAGRYIRAVTEAIHEAHAAAAVKRAKPKRKPGIAIAAAADERPLGKGRRTSRGKKKSKGKRGRKA
jgi:hypothetical protein